MQKHYFSTNRNYYHLAVKSNSNNNYGGRERHSNNGNDNDNNKITSGTRRIRTSRTTITIAEAGIKTMLSLATREKDGNLKKKKMHRD